MNFKESQEKLISELEAKLSEGDVKRCQETARLSKFHDGMKYEGAYITALLMKVDLYKVKR